MQVSISIPNSLTALRIILTPVFVILLFSESPFLKQLSLVVYVFAALTDWYDGWIARRYAYESRWGKFLDPLADKILVAAALFSFVALKLAEAWMVWIIVIRDFLITGLRSYAELSDRPIVTSRTAQAKTFGEFVVIYYALILYVANYNPVVRENYGDLIDTLMRQDILFGMFLVVTLSTIGTGIMYLIDNRKLVIELYERISGPSR